jgi:spoIIIJ-associated protein
MAESEDAMAAQELEPEALPQDQRVALEVMTEICEASQMEMRPVVRHVQPPYLHIELVGGDVRQTWGRYGQALDSLQFLANLILSRRIRSDVRVVLDADSYRERRANALRARALELAREVTERQEEAELEPLPPHERRIIHTALAGHPDIMTYSEGDEPDRRIVISPRR